MAEADCCPGTQLGQNSLKLPLDISCQGRALDTREMAIASSPHLTEYLGQLLTSITIFHLTIYNETLKIEIVSPKTSDLCQAGLRSVRLNMTNIGNVEIRFLTFRYLIKTLTSPYLHNIQVTDLVGLVGNVGQNIPNISYKVTRLTPGQAVFSPSK